MLKNKLKILTGMLSVSLAAALLIGGGTLSYLYSPTEDKVNTFNSNLVNTAMDNFNVKINERGDGQYQIIPGTAQTKDPKVTLSASVDSYVYLYMTDTTEELVEYQIDTDTWTEIDNSDGEWDYVLELKGYPTANTKIYYTEAEVTETGTVEEIEYGVLVGNTVSYKSSLENGDMLDAESNLREGLALTFSAEAIQTEGFADYEEALVTLQLSAIEATQAGYSWTIDTNNDTASITGYNGSDTELTIPSKIYDKDTDGLYTVTNIAIRAFKNSTLITSVTIPDSVKSIESNAFAGCSNLQSITIPDSVTSI